MTYSFLFPILGWVLTLTAPVETAVSNPQFVGAVPRLTTDAAGNPLLSWVEKEGDKGAAFYFATSADGGQTFGEKTMVKAPATIAVHAEGMPKIEEKADGTLLAVFEVPKPTEQSRFAGDLLYTLSTDQGKTWTDAKPVHQDASPGKSHSFSDITRLPNGEIGIAWLDEKLPGREGRPVVFAQTTKGKGFGAAVLVDDNACQCCRTNVFVDAKRNIHLTYRDLLPPAKTGNIASRDISTAVSADGGKTFSKPQVVFPDHWQVNACPHAGPVVTQLGNDMLITWFSGKENAVGLRLARLGSDRLASSVLSNRAKHPQVATAGNQLVWVWDESISKDGSGEMGSFVQRIGMRTFDGKASSTTTYITPESVDATYPAVMATKQGVLVAYEQTKGKENTMIVARLLEVQ
ncbi:sialidase family protein [Spirosoma endophyticum]|uniref:BNR repeat-like domain-containing protein n=1 Tax=Spirosoma endophyticum TaxID=662367 RepID=A0A1I2BZ72_9BACT|nr:sialidase family protein [Spirosoma endophyticum]SFE61476.1 BNR repeat-like domain-containing protein [Spirosoma endophyticum]